MEIVEIVASFVAGFVTMWGLLRFRPRKRVIDDILDTIGIDHNGHEHDFRIAGKRGNEIMRECSTCKRVVYRDT